MAASNTTAPSTAAPSTSASSTATTLSFPMPHLSKRASKGFRGEVTASPHVPQRREPFCCIAPGLPWHLQSELCGSWKQWFRAAGVKTLSWCRNRTLAPVLAVCGQSLLPGVGESSFLQPVLGQCSWERDVSNKDPARIWKGPDL